MMHGIVPPYLLDHIAQLQSEKYAVATAAARQALIHDEGVRETRAGLRHDEPRSIVADVTGSPDRTIWDAAHTQALPGRLVRREGQYPAGAAGGSTAETRDIDVSEAFEGLGATFALYSDVFARNSIDGRGLALDATVHYGSLYDNAFWNGDRMVFGDGDGQIFTRFTGSLSVIGHELTHGVTQYSAGLDYAGQAGALNESVSDVFGVLVEQYALKQTAAKASWLIGAGLFTANVHGTALRSMKAPGTAYDDAALGRDPQPADFAHHVTTDDDNGGVHLNSGIPNRAFYLVAAKLGGNAWERAGRIWYDALTGPLASNSSFAQFASATVATATSRYGSGSAEVDAVKSGWSGVGVGVAR